MRITIFLLIPKILSVLARNGFFAIDGAGFAFSSFQRRGNPEAQIGNKGNSLQYFPTGFRGSLEMTGYGLNGIGTKILAPLYEFLQHV